MGAPIEIGLGPQEARRAREALVVLEAHITVTALFYGRGPGPNVLKALEELRALELLPLHESLKPGTTP